MDDGRRGMKEDEVVVSLIPRPDTEALKHTIKSVPRKSSGQWSVVSGQLKTKEKEGSRVSLARLSSSVFN
jgi:hypothetical protein